LLVDVNDALSILHETTVKHGQLALSTRKLWFKKVAQKLKYCIEKIYKGEVKSAASALDENSKDLCLFCAMLEELQEIYKRSTSCIDHVQIFTQFPFTTIERTMKEFGVSNVVKKIRALKKEKKRVSRRVL